MVIDAMSWFQRLAGLVGSSKANTVSFEIRDDVRFLYYLVLTVYRPIHSALSYKP